MHQTTHNLVQYFRRWPLRREGQTDRHLLNFHLMTCIQIAAPSGRTVLSEDLRSLAFWYYGFESAGSMDVCLLWVFVLSGKGLCDELITHPEEFYRVLLVQRPLPDNTQHSQQTSMPPVVFEPTFPASEPPQSQALDGAATVFYSQILCVSLIFRQCEEYILFTDLTVICATVDCKIFYNDITFQ
jgi:hypothetical protein